MTAWCTWAAGAGGARGGRRLAEAGAAAAEGSGWGAPARRGAVLYAANAGDVEARGAENGTGDWTVTLDTTTLPPDAPAVQRNTAWVSLQRDGSDGVTAVDTRKGAQAWTYVQGTSGPWRAEAAGNRVFLLRGRHTHGLARLLKPPAAPATRRAAHGC
ncbi:hypothetical protein ACF06W_03095 [Streptomyces albus]|uniref:hypothetical protein n=1 Tax=Streptomyces albus TaxID=1888 RepID=UPI003702185B